MTTLHKAASQPSRIPPCHHCGGRVVRRRDVNDVYLQCSTCGRFPESPVVETEVQVMRIPHHDQPHRQEYLNDRVPSPAAPSRKSEPTPQPPQQDKEIAVLAQTTTDSGAALPLPEDIHNMTNEQAIALTQHVRWPDGPECPRCGSKNVSSQTKYQPQPYRCHECKAYYSHRHGSFIRTKLYTKPWLASISATIQLQRPLTLDEFLDVTRRKSSKAATDAHEIYLKAAELIDLDPDRAPSPNQATKFLNISEDLVPQDLHSGDAAQPASADPDPEPAQPAQAEQTDSQPTAGPDPVPEVSEPADSEPANTDALLAESESPNLEPAAANPQPASPEPADPDDSAAAVADPLPPDPLSTDPLPADPTSPDPESQQQQPEGQPAAGGNDQSAAGDETPTSPPESERPYDLEDTARSLPSPIGNLRRRPVTPHRTSRPPQTAEKHKADPTNADAGMFSHDPEPANDVERQSEATFQISEKPQCRENGMLQGLAATIAGLNREQRQELDTILNTTLRSVVSPSASVSPEPAVAESTEPATTTPDPESTGETPKEAIQEPEQPIVLHQDAQPTPKPVLSAQRPVGVRYHSFGPHHA